jgi:chromosome segregation ATPase
MTPTNQPTESKGERPIETPWTYKEGDFIVRGADCSQVCEIDYEQDGRFIAEAGTVYHETGLTPRQLAERVRELERREEATRECQEANRPAFDWIAAEWERILGPHPIIPGSTGSWQQRAEAIVKERDQLAERVKEWHEAAQGWSEERASIRDQLAASEAAREEMRAAVQKAWNRYADLSHPGALDLEQALAQQPAECLAKREEEREQILTALGCHPAYVVETICDNIIQRDEAAKQRDEAQRSYRKEYQMRDFLYSQMGQVLTLLEQLDTVKVSSAGLPKYADAIGLARLTIDRAFKQISEMRGPLITPSIAEAQAIARATGRKEEA